MVVSVKGAYYTAQCACMEIRHGVFCTLVLSFKDGAKAKLYINYNMYVVSVAHITIHN